MPDPLGCTFIPAHIVMGWLQCLSICCGTLVLICIIAPKYVQKITGMHGWYLAFVYIIFMAGLTWGIMDSTISPDSADENCAFVIDLGK